MAGVQLAVVAMAMDGFGMGVVVPRMALII